MAQPRFSVSRFVFGLALIFAGTVFLLDQADLIRAEDILDYWPLFLVFAGLGKLFFPGTSSRFAGLLMIIVGVWLQLEFLHMIEYSIFDFWPVFLVLVGLRVTWAGLFGRRRRSDDEASEVNGVAVLGGAKRVNRSQSFRGGDLLAFMGGCEVDLRGAEISESPAVIDTFACMGGIEIRVPDHWVVVANGMPLLGGFEDTTRAEDGGPQLIIRGFAIMGAVEIKN